MSSDPRDPPDTPIEDWLAGLHRSGAGEGSTEARALAGIVERRAAAEAAAVARAGLDTAEAEERALQQLRFRLRREGVDFRARQPARWWAAGAVATIAIAVTATLFRPQADDPWATYDREPPTFRGGAKIEKGSADPRTDARSLAAKLHSAGVAPLVYVQADRAVVSFVLETAQVGSIGQTVLAPLGLTGAREGENQVVFVKGRQ